MSVKESVTKPFPPFRSDPDLKPLFTPAYRIQEALAAQASKEAHQRGITVEEVLEIWNNTFTTRDLGPDFGPDRSEIDEADSADDA